MTFVGAKQRRRFNWRDDRLQFQSTGRTEPLGFRETDVPDHAR
jgi:hypothetical protein